MSIGKSRLGRQSPYQLGLSAPPRPKNSIIGSSIVMAGSGTPTCTSVPARSRAKNACCITSGRPTASMQTSAPLPSVSARMASTGSRSDAFDGVCRAELLRDLELARVEVDGDHRGRARRGATPTIAASPTPPQPNTATESPRCTLPVSIAAPSPAITPHPSSPAAVGDASGSTFVA